MGWREVSADQIFIIEDRLAADGADGCLPQDPEACFQLRRFRLDALKEILVFVELPDAHTT